MAREFSVVVGINATRAIAGGRQFKAGADQVNRSNRTMQASTARTTKRMTAMITTMGRFRGVASLMFAGFLGVGGISSVIRTISQFQTKISQVTALIAAQNPRSLGGAMAALTERARDLGATTLFTANQAAEGMRFLSLAGFDALEVYQAIEPVLTLATVGMLDLGNAADIVSNIMAAFAIEAENTNDVVNALAFVSSRTNTNIQQLGEAMKFVGPVAGALGINVQETSVALGILGNSGLQASLAGTSLRRVMSGLLNPSKEAKKVFASMGVTQEELVATMRGPEGLVNLVELLAAKGIDAADAFLLFGQRGAPGLLSLVNQKDKLREFTEGLEEMGDIAKKQAAIIADNLGADAKIAISALNDVILTIGDSGFGDWLREVTQSATGFFRALTDTVTPADEMTAAMQKGANAAEFLKNNVDNLKKGMFIFIAFLNRQMLVTIATLIGRFVLLSATVAGLAGPFAVASAGATLLSGALNILKRAIITTGIGALVVAVGYLLDWAFASDEATESAEELTQAMVDQRIEAEKLVFVFDLLDAGDRTRAIAKTIKALEAQTALLDDAKQKMEGFATAADGLATFQNNLTLAQEALNKELEGTEAYAAAAEKVRIAEQALVAFNDALEQGKYGETKAEMERLQGVVDMLTEDLEAMKLVASGVAQNMDDARDMINKVGMHAEGAAAPIKELSKEMQDLKTGFVEMVEEADPAGVAMAKVQAKMDAFAKVAALSEEELEKLKITSEEMEMVQVQLNHEMSEAKKILSDVEKEEKKLKDARKKQWDILQDLRDGTGTVAALTREYERALVNMAVAVAAGTLTVKEFWEMQQILKGTLDENIEKLENTCKKTDDLRKCMSDNAKAMQTLWDQALRNIQDAFADAFRGAFESSSDFFDAILDAFKDMISQMLAAWAVSGIANLFNGQSFNANGNSFGGMLQQGVSSMANRAMGGGGGGGAGGSSSSGGGGIFSSTGAVGSQIYGEGTMLGDAFASFTAGTVAFFQGAGALVGIGESAGALGIANTGIAGFGTSGASISAAGGSTAAVAGNVTAGAAIGIITGYIADQLLGSRGDPTRNMIFSAIGGAIGAYYGGAIGAIIGGAIGSLVDNIFGGAKKLESATVALSIAGTEFSATQTEVVSTQKSFFRGKKYKTTERDVGYKFNALERQFIDFADALDDVAEHFGGSSDGFLDNFSASLSLNIKRMNSDQIQAALQAFMNRTMLRAIQVWLNDVEGLDSDIHTVLSSLSGNIEVFARAIQSLMTITALFEIDLVEEAAKAIEEGSIGVIESYDRQLAAYREVIAAHDGSIESLELLTDASVIFAAVQLELIAVYQQLGDQISGMFQGSAQTIREAMLSEEELYDLRRTQIDELVEQASMTTDPEELSRLAEEINRLGLDAFSMLDESQIAELGPEFIEFFEGLDDLFGGQITEGINSVVQDQADLDLEVATRMEEAAQAIIDAAAALQREADRRQRERELRDEHHR